MAPARFTRLRGTVVAYDRAVGLGEVCADEGGCYRFHATRIADGTRSVAVGAAVDFTVAAIGLGAWEAVDLVGVGVSPSTSA